MTEKSRPRKPVNASPSAAFGVAGLDDVLGGGLPRERIFLLQGDPGVGKTTLALQFLLEGVRAGESCLYATLSETSEELITVARSHGWSLEGIELFELPAPGGDGEDENTLFHPSEVELGEVTKLLLDRVDEVKPKRVVLDSLSEFRLLSQGQLRYRRQILALKHYFVGRRATALLLDDRTDDSGGLGVQSLAHGVIALEQLSPLYGAERRRLRVVKMRGVRFRGGYHDFAMETGGLRVFPRLVAAEHAETIHPGQLSSHVPQIDRLMGGGIDRGTSTLFMGPAGTGKSMVALQYIHAVASEGKRAAVFTFDESAATILVRAKGIGIDLQQHIQAGRVDLRQIDPAELTPGEFTQAVRNAVEKNGASLVVIDSLNGFLHAMPQEQFLMLQLHELLTFLGQKGVVTLMLVAQQGLVGSSIESPVDVSYLADAVMMFRHFEDGGRLRKVISVLKKRTGKHEDAIREMTITDHGILVGEPLTTFRGVLAGVPVPTSLKGEHES
ncbi:MAG TPA: ATPase domain-containing protein [Polyangia bacterium]|nr:ATPase domain-containing protein [Polyangia bacterium]